MGDRKIEYLIVHCSDSEWGNVEVIRQWHLERGWRDIGYHRVILNGFISYDKFIENQRDYALDGAIESGRPDDIIGAHVKGMNSNSLGICLIGTKYFTYNQLCSLFKLLLTLIDIYNIPIDNILGHNECPTGKEQGKTCPNIDMNWIRGLLRIIRD